MASLFRRSLKNYQCDRRGVCGNDPRQLPTCFFGIFISDNINFPAIKEGCGIFDVEGMDKGRREEMPLMEGIPLGKEDGYVDGSDEGRREGVPLGGEEGRVDVLGKKMHLVHG